MSNIYALQGKGNSGKTETIKNVFQSLQVKYPSAVMNVLSNNTIDIKVIININGTKVGIESQGDPNSRLQQSLQDFSNANCDIIICACRTSGMTVQWINSHSNQYTITFIQQRYATTNNQSLINSQTAAQMILMAGL